MKLWVCYNCGEMPFGKPFEGPNATCPECGLSERVLERATIHFDPPHAKLKNKGTGVRPCDGQPVCGPVKMTLNNRETTRMATGDPSSVTCQKCRESEEWKAAYTGEPVVADETAA
jgi:ssDNA-binding Zn-finger/Zn-ribbon topoisomerase 1